MSSNNVNWRQRMAEKQRREKEALAFAAEQERAKHAVLNETNFPTHLVASARQSAYMTGFANRAHAAEIKDQVEKRMQEYRKQRAEMDAHTNHQFASGVVPLRRRRKHHVEEEIVEDEVVPTTLDERFPSHGRRRRTTPPDNEGWREVTRYYRKKRMMTDAELERKARAEILGEEDEEEDVNGDLGDRNQRREFY
jgi:hypothetical protein